MTTRAWRRGLPAVRLVSRASESAFASDAEREELVDWLRRDGSPESRSDEVRTHAIVRRANEILLRELGQQDEPLTQIREFGTSLVALEGALLQGLEEKSLSYAAEQKRHRLCTLVFAVSAAAIGSVAAVVAVLRPGSAAVVASTAAIPTVLAVIFARLYQNQRDAAERLDEKAVAVRFLRVALSSWSYGDRPEILEYAVRMFVAFNGPRSSPLGPEDWGGLAALLRDGGSSAKAAREDQVPRRLESPPERGVA